MVLQNGENGTRPSHDGQEMTQLGDLHLFNSKKMMSQEVVGWVVENLESVGNLEGAREITPWGNFPGVELCSQGCLGKLLGNRVWGSQDASSDVVENF